jgi:hypothetical protein
LEPFARGFLFWLIELGYSWTAQTARLRLMAELSSWMAVRVIGPKELTASLVNEFLEPLRARGSGKEWCSETSERQLLGYLRGLGLASVPDVPVVSDPVDLLVAEFVVYLVRERGLSVGTNTVYEYERTARLFLAGRVDPDGGGLDRLATSDVTSFVLAECRRGSYRMSSGLVSSPRGLLRLLSSRA